jgi:hypothetical protein
MSPIDGSHRQAKCLLPVRLVEQCPTRLGRNTIYNTLVITCLRVLELFHRRLKVRVLMWVLGVLGVLGVGVLGV